jgi:hypothetical protein
LLACGLNFWFFLFAFIHRLERLDNIMEMRHILSDEKSGERLAALAIGVIGGNDSDELSTVRIVGEDNRSTADSVNRDAVDQISTAVSAPRTDASREEAKSPGFDTRKTEPTNLDPRY